jgi:hypothetical protein
LVGGGDVDAGVEPFGDVIVERGDADELVAEPVCGPVVHCSHGEVDRACREGDRDGVAEFPSVRCCSVGGDSDAVVTECGEITGDGAEVEQPTDAGRIEGRQKHPLVVDIGAGDTRFTDGRDSELGSGDGCEFGAHAGGGVEGAGIDDVGAAVVLGE